MQGKIKNKPGPLAPPGKILPKRKITALSYSLTILITIMKNAFNKKNELLQTI